MEELVEELEEVKQKKEPTTDKWLFFLTGITFISIGFASLLYGRGIRSFIKPYGLTIMLLFILYVGVSLSKAKALLLKLDGFKFTIGYIIGLSLIILAGYYPVYHLWLLGGAFVSLLVNDLLGVALQFIFAYLYCGLNGYNMELMLFYFILGAVICLLARYMYKMELMIYASIIVLCCNIILVFVMNGFTFQKSFNENVVFSILSTVVVLFTIYITRKFWIKEKIQLDVESSIEEQDNVLQSKDCKKEQDIMLQNEVSQMKDIINDKENEETKVISEVTLLENEESIQEEPLNLCKNYSDNKNNKEKIRIDKGKIEEVEKLEGILEEPKKEDNYELILDENYELLQQLRRKSVRIFEHSKEVANLARKGAVLLEINENIVAAGAFYHEIGRVVSKNYIEAGVYLLQKYEFPVEVIDILKQQNAKIELPKSKEAAIVMLAESIVSTITYFEKEEEKAVKSGQKYEKTSLRDVVEHIFDVRFNKGDLDEAGFTILEYKKLKEYYMNMYT